MTRDHVATSSPRLSRRRLAGLSAAALAASALPGAAPRAATAQSMDPFTYITAMTETETLGQRAGQPLEEVGPVEADGIQWTAMIQVPIKRGQDLHYTCEFDSAWSIMKAYGIDSTLESQLAAVGIDDRLEPYWEDQGNVVMIYGGDIGQYFCGDLDTNLVAKTKGSAMVKSFEAHGLAAVPVRDRPSIEQAINLGYPVFFKSTVDFLDWRPAIWNTPEGIQYQVVFSNDHALTVMAYNDTEVVIRDPLGPTSTNTQRPFQFRASWDRFLQVFAAQENDGLAVMPPGASLTGGAEPQAPEPQPTQAPAASSEPVSGDGTGGAEETSEPEG